MFGPSSLSYVTAVTEGPFNSSKIDHFANLFLLRPWSVFSKRISMMEKYLYTIALASILISYEQLELILQIWDVLQCNSAHYLRSVVWSR